MIQVIHDNEGVHSVKIHNTTYSPEALALMASEIERHRAALELLSQGHVFDAAAFADAVLSGQSVQSAHEADVIALSLPNEAEEQIAVDAALKRIDARKAIIRAAMAWAAAPGEHEHHKARLALHDAVAAYRAAGGDEVIG
jgi:hydrogenase maturation factor HypF (carbamoyltransferase family)